jgi:hypothetical protein
MIDRINTNAMTGLMLGRHNSQVYWQGKTVPMLSR